MRRELQSRVKRQMALMIDKPPEGMDGLYASFVLTAF